VIPFLRLLLSFAAGLVLAAHAGQTVVSISGEEFLVNGTPTYAGQFWQGHKVQGLLMNARQRLLPSELRPWCRVKTKWSGCLMTLGPHRWKSANSLHPHALPA
jgi:hypothetical protein